MTDRIGWRHLPELYSLAGERLRKAVKEGKGEVASFYRHWLDKAAGEESPDVKAEAERLAWGDNPEGGEK